MKDIKSLKISKQILFLLDEKTKLDLVKYNKTLQNKININLINYICFSGKNIVYGEKGIVKEYDDNGQLIFEGEYLNGKRNGKGKDMIKMVK